MHRLLITGGAGFIGSYINKIFCLAGYETVILDNLSRGDRRTVLEGTFVEGDISDRSLLDSLFAKHHFQGVIHLAADIQVGASLSNPLPFYQNNVGGALTLLEVMKKYETPFLIFSSSAAIYGLPKQSKIDESHPKQPISPYGQTKWMVEQVLADCSRASPMRYCALRYFNAAGGDPDGQIKIYNQNPQNLIPIALQKLYKQEPLTLFGDDYDTCDGTCVRDYIHLSDLANAHLLAYEHLRKGASSTAYNLGNEKGFSTQEVIDMIERVTNQKLITQIGPRREGDPPQLIADSTKGRNALNWKPKYPHLEQMIQHAWEAYAK